MYTYIQLFIQVSTIPGYNSHNVHDGIILCNVYCLNRIVVVSI